MNAIAVGDYVVPDNEYGHIWTPCRVRNIYKNGSLRAVADDSTVSVHGPISGYRLAASNQGAHDNA